MLKKKELYREAVIKLLQMPFFVAAIIFVPAGTIAYWQGWLFLAVFSFCTIAITAYLAVHDPALLARRMHAGPTAEQDKTQKIIMTFAFVSVLAYVVSPTIDYRFGWSHVPLGITLIGNLLMIIGYWLIFLVFKENTYTASTITVEKGQTVTTTGLYAHIRHPMYSGALIMLLGIPPALGSWWGLVLFVVILAGIIWRLLEEERYLRKHLPGYKAYCEKVTYRLVPHVW